MTPSRMLTVARIIASNAASQPAEARASFIQREIDTFSDHTTDRPTRTQLGHITKAAWAALDCTAIGDGSALALVEEIKAGEFVKRTPDSHKVYKRGAYDRSGKAYELHDQDDASRSILVRAGTMLVIGFTY